MRNRPRGSSVDPATVPTALGGILLGAALLPATAVACNSMRFDHVNWNLLLFMLFGPALVLTAVKQLWLREVLTEPRRTAKAWVWLLCAKGAGLAGAGILSFATPAPALAALGYVAGHLAVAGFVLAAFGSRAVIANAMLMTILLPALHVGTTMGLFKMFGSQI